MAVPLADRLADLAALFNQESLDVPPDLLGRGCVFRLNGVAYEDTMGRPTTDPIVRLVARGPAAYRFLAQAVRYALPGARVAIDYVVPEQPQGNQLASAMATIEGTLRGTETRFRAKAALALVLDGRGVVQELAVMMKDEQVAAIVEARRR